MVEIKKNTEKIWELLEEVKDPEVPVLSVVDLFANPAIVPCPLCKSKNTRMISQFGSTACKAHYQCNDCLEPFDYFKCLK